MNEEFNYGGNQEYYSYAENAHYADQNYGYEYYPLDNQYYGNEYTGNYQETQYAGNSYPDHQNYYSNVPEGNTYHGGARPKQEKSKYQQNYKKPRQFPKMHKNNAEVPSSSNNERTGENMTSNFDQSKFKSNDKENAKKRVRKGYSNGFSRGSYSDRNSFRQNKFLNTNANSSYQSTAESAEKFYESANSNDLERNPKNGWYGKIRYYNKRGQKSYGPRKCWSDRQEHYAHEDNFDNSYRQTNLRAPHMNNKKLPKGNFGDSSSQSFFQTPHMNNKKIPKEKKIVSNGNKKTDSASSLKDISKKFRTVLNITEDDKMQRDKMIELMEAGKYECMVCYDNVKQNQAIWSCENCYNCFHLGCTKKWALSSKEENGWRCPACQNVEAKVPSQYKCFCKKLREPTWNRRDCPHSCGDNCGKKRGPEWCSHKCNILCHPGPCPPCTAYIQRACACGDTKKSVKCSQTEPFVCENTCSKLLNCQVHRCSKPCHLGDCDNCDEKVTKSCYCGKTKSVEQCTEEANEVTEFSCKETCGKVLDCLLHYCKEECHEGDCKPCERTIPTVTTCPCGKTSLQGLYAEGYEVRKSCEDPIPTCTNVCEKRLKCGVPGNFHLCQSLCHDGPCPVCPKKTPVRCRCGAVDAKIQCKDLHVKADEVTCEKQCKKMRKCGRHKCGQKCCIDIDHLCDRICGKLLSCGLHRCEDPCHRNNCSKCWRASFDELTCHCGSSVMYPPVDCGSAPPSCDKPCRRERNCEHAFTHICHEGPCPPCTMFVAKKCCGDHMIMKSTPCYVSALSCGKLCMKPLPCGLHVCQKICHEGPCQTKKKCSQKCLKPRSDCGHPCGAACHPNGCPNHSCKVQVTVTCICGNRKASVACSENERVYRALTTSRLANAMQNNLSSSSSVDISQIFGRGNPEKFKSLECDDDCKLTERNNRLALALQIQNPETREKLGESNNLYSEQLKEDARKNMPFASMIHETLHDLVMRSKESKHKSRSHSFAPMSREKRRFIHEYSKHFFCESQAYDEEPKKNVVVTAQKGTCCLPPLSIIELIQKESGTWSRKIAPVLNMSNTKIPNDKTLKVLEKSSSLDGGDDSKPSKPIDYFDME